MKAVLKTNFNFLSRGTVLRQDCNGNYFVSLPDEEIVNSPIQHSKITLDKHCVEGMPDIFELIDKDEGASKLLNDAIQLLEGMGDNSVAGEAIKKIRLAMRSSKN